MALKLDDNFLQEVGLGGLPQEEKTKLLAQVYETLETRVGMRLAGQMSDAQLREFEGFIDKKDEQGALKWLETNYPDYPKVVKEELEKLKGELKRDSDKITQSIKES